MRRRSLRATTMVIAGLGLATLVACAPRQQPSGVNDPAEGLNRVTHGANKALDRGVFGPTAKGYGFVVPQPVRTGVSNVADTLDLPGDIANHLLQARVDRAAISTLRLGLNLTLGVAGIFDVASDIGLPRNDTDFGQTLHAWGVGEGPYVEMPLLGPSTARDAVGTVVDLVANPVNNWVEGTDAVGVGVAKVLSRLNDRARYSRTVESILYESEDSYAQARLLYLQNRRHQLAKDGAAADQAEAGADSDFIDPYED